MALNLAVIEAASWRLAATLLRRNPRLNLYKAHPGSGMYDVLFLRSHNGADIRLNRAHGTIQVHGHEGGDKIGDVRRIDWSEVLESEATLAIAARLEHEARLEPNLGWTLMTNRDVVVETIAALTALGAHDRRFEVSSGFLNVDGFSHGPAEWWEDFTTMAPDEVQPTDDWLDQELGHPGYRFWRVARDDFCLTFDMRSALVWPRLPEHLDLSHADDLEEARLLFEDLVEFARVETSVAGRPLFNNTEPQTTGPDPLLPLLRAALEIGQERAL